MNLRLLIERHLEFLSYYGGCTGSSESTLVKCGIGRFRSNRSFPVTWLKWVHSSIGTCDGELIGRPKLRYKCMSYEAFLRLPFGTWRPQYCDSLVTSIENKAESFIKGKQSFINIYISTTSLKKNLYI